jgi:hypothetical protein
MDTFEECHPHETRFDNGSETKLPNGRLFLMNGGRQSPRCEEPTLVFC